MTTVADPPRIPREVPDWHDQGLCRSFPELDSPEFNAWHDSRPGSPEQLAARIICAACPVRFLCGQGALERGEPWGIWGGLDRHDRADIAREYGYDLPGDPPEHGTNSRYAKWGCKCPDCTAAHTLYESQRRERAKARLWFPLELDRAIRINRRWVCAGQLAFPLRGVPVAAPRRSLPTVRPHLSLVA